MTLYIATTFRIPPAIARLVRKAGVHLLSQSGLGADEIGHYTGVDEGIWAEAQVAARRAFIAIRDGDATPVLAACRVLGLDERYGREALAQSLAQDTLYRLNFVHICRHAFPDTIVIADFPPALRLALAKEGFRFHAALSRLAWMARRLGLVAGALAAHAAHLVLRLGDEMRPAILGLAPQQTLVLWPGVYDGELGAADNALNVSDFVAARRKLFPPGEIVVCEGNPAARHAPPMTIAATLFPLRRAGRGSAGAIIGDLFTQLRLAWATAAGSWGEAMMGRECAKLPRARACLADLRPRAIFCTIGLLPYLPLWFAFSRQAGAPVRVLCNSTQVFPVRTQAASVPDLIPGIYMLLSADEYLVWNDTHAKHLRDIGVAAGNIEIAGPQILSGKPRSGAAIDGSDSTIIIDYFDQPPASRDYLIRIGAPTIYHTPERTLAAVDGVLDAIRLAFGERPWRLRIKSKRGGGSHTPAVYSNHLAELADTYKDRVVLLPPETSPLYLHPDANATIGFPYVSPVVSATLAGCPGAYFDATNEVYEANGVAGEIPVLRNVDSLAAWLGGAMKSQAEAG
jgi:hypothetical protein